jgi:hypothetical protein
LQPYADTAMAHFPGKGEVRAAFPGASAAVRVGPNLQK